MHTHDAKCLVYKAFFVFERQILRNLRVKQVVLDLKKKHGLIVLLITTFFDMQTMTVRQKKLK